MHDAGRSLSPVLAAAAKTVVSATNLAIAVYQRA